MRKFLAISLLIATACVSFGQDYFVDQSGYVTADGGKFTDNLNMDSNSITGALDVEFTPTGEEPSSSEGNVFWSSEEHTLTLVSGLGPKLQVGQESWLYGINNTGIDMTNGQAVFVSGSSGTQPKFDLASSTNPNMHGVSVLTMDCPASSNCYATAFGLVRDIEISAITNASDGAEIYLDSGQGQITTTQTLYHIGLIVDAVGSSGKGTVLVGYENHDLIQDGYTYPSSDGANITNISSVSGYLPLSGGTMSGDIIGGNNRLEDFRSIGGNFLFVTGQTGIAISSSQDDIAITAKDISLTGTGDTITIFSGQSLSLSGPSVLSLASTNFIQVNRDLLPLSASNLNIGSASLPFHSGYFSSNSIYLGAIRLSEQGGTLAIVNTNDDSEATFDGVHIGDGSGLTNLPSAGGGGGAYAEVGLSTIYPTNATGFEVAGSTNSTIAGGQHNTITNASHVFIGSGSNNLVSKHFDSAIVAGTGNKLYTSSSKENHNIIGAGNINQIKAGSGNALMSGVNNVIGDNSDYSFIGSGSNNDVGSGADYASVLGGYNNNALASHSSIAGGLNCNVAGQYGFAVGLVSYAEGTAGVAMGTRALAGTGCFMFSDSQDAGTYRRQPLQDSASFFVANGLHVASGTTTNAGKLYLSPNNTNSYITYSPDNSAPTSLVFAINGTIIHLFTNGTLNVAP